MQVSLYEIETPGWFDISLVVMPCGVGGNWAVANEPIRAMLLTNDWRSAIGKLEVEEYCGRTVLSMVLGTIGNTEHNIHSDGRHVVFE